MSDNAWHSGQPAIMALTNKLLELKLRLMRLELAQKMSRAQAVVQALGARRE